MRGIAIEGDAQLIFVDTPGIFSPRRRLDRAMVATAWSGAHDADVVALMVDAKRGLDDETAGIAARLIISEGTVKSHVKHILRKLGAANRAEAVCRYLRMESGNATERSQMSNGPAVPRQRW